LNTDHESNKNTVRVRLFGFSSRVVGKSEIKIELTGRTSIRDIRRTLLSYYPALMSHNIPFVFAVNRKVVVESTIVTHLDEVALLPPVSGG
jgi:molybdopterin converting factor small subunit